MTMFTPRLAALALTLFIFGGAFLIFVVGLFATVIVRDPTGEVVRATMFCDHDEQALHDLPGGLFIGFTTSLDCSTGEVEIACSDGARDVHGYVRQGLNTRLRVEPGCRLAG